MKRRDSNKLMEALETRRLASMSLDPVSHVLTITGTETADRIEVTASGRGLAAQLNVRMNAESGRFARSQVDQVVISARGGNDVIAVSTQGATTLIFAGDGNDTVTGSASADTIYGGRGNDSIRGMMGNDVLCGEDGSDRLFGDSGNDFLNGMNDNDELFGGAGSDTLSGSAGNDTLVAIGGDQTDRLTGGAGFDSFWLDAESTERITDPLTTTSQFAAETRGRNIHRIARFNSLRIDGATTTVTTVTREWYSNLPDPVIGGGSQTGYVSYRGQKLFSTAGPRPGDIDQNALGDCYFMAPLSAVAKLRPNIIRQAVADLGDGTYAVRFVRDGRENYVRVDGDLPASYGALVNAGLGAEGSVWCAIMEKAWAFFRSNAGTYASLEGGWPSEIFDALGCPSVELPKGATPGAMLQNIADALVRGKAVTFATAAATTLVGGHCYMVDRVNRLSDGTPVSITLRNPWGGTGAYVAVTGAAAFADHWFITAANV